MERPAGGRRHSRGGSVSVADLIRRQPGSVRIPTPEEAATDGLLGDLLGGKGLPDDSDPRTSPALKVLGLLVGAITLAGTVAAASMITSDPRPAKAAVVASPQPEALTGVDALRPDVLATELAGKTTDAEPLSAATTTTSPSTTTSTPTAAGTPRALTANAPADPVDVVRDFYNTVAQNPRDALAMIGGSLAELDPTGFIRSWSTVRAVRPERVEAMTDNTVLGVIGIQQSDGSWLHVEQLLKVDGGNQPKIVNAQVLSAVRG
ncbi:hypothetical protein [Kutzneria chonburiensis]|uniref:Uncharacterized protein n=1 Tax=Kutzneria chonburiensis TaxID=1483604 RepID=A0ABV6MVX7_9PSEU|nr:hypothetical protein [Kutzneria chonburiensis]